MGEPTGRRRRPRKGDVREEEILASAAALLRQRPLNRVTVAEIAEGAGITAPTFYFYFSTKTDVLAALLDRVADRMREQLAGWLDADGAAAASGGAAESLEAVLGTAACLWSDHAPLLREILLSADPDPRLRGFRERMRDSLVPAVARRIEADRAAGRALPGPPDATALAGVLAEMTVAAFASAAERGDPALRDGRLVRTLTSVVLRAVYGTEEPGPRNTVGG